MTSCMYVVGQHWVFELFLSSYEQGDSKAMLDVFPGIGEVVSLTSTSDWISVILIRYLIGRGGN